MKKLLLALIILIFSCTAAYGNFTFWALGDSSGEALTVRVGYEKDNIEVGGSFSSYEINTHPEVYGVYGLYNFEQIDVNCPIDLEFLPDTLRAKPYLGAQASININEHSSYAGLIAGFWVQDIIIFEYSHYDTEDSLSANGLNDEHKFFIGLKKEF